MPSAPSPTNHDADLAACAAGDSQALRRIYDAEVRQMIGVALRIVRERQRAEDVVHDAFLSIWEKASSFDAARGSGRGWIYSVVRHRALNALRDGARELQVDDEGMELLQDRAAMEAHAAGSQDIGGSNAQADTRAGVTPVGDADWTTTLPLMGGPLNDCLARLDAAKQSSILLAYVEGCTHAEIAERLRTPLGTVKAWIRRGLQSLRDCMA